MSLISIYIRHKDKGIFKKLPPRREANDPIETSRYCPLHEANRHGLYICEALMPVILELMKEGKIREYRANTAKTTNKVEVRAMPINPEPIVREILALHEILYIRKQRK